MIYVKPPRGEILLNELYECVISRIYYFLHRYRQDPTISKDAIKFEHLVLGTAFDRVGHFILRLLCITCDPLKEFVLSAETEFIIERLEFLTPKEIRLLINTTLRHLNENEHKDLLLNEATNVLTEMKSAYSSSHMQGFNHEENCAVHSFIVPFQLSLKLVAKRELLLERGQVIVPCGKWKRFWKCFFEYHLSQEIKKLESNMTALDNIADQRFKDLKHILLNSLFRNSIDATSKTNVSVEELGNLKRLFPPCMSNLYNKLTINHRLSHNARFYFSLFLKDIGLSVNESIAFWRREYSKPSRCGVKCSHSWQKDVSKYMYSIRHIYGLEGRRANYCAPSCHRIQNNSIGPLEEGGCPFQHFDPQSLRDVLDPNIVENKEIYDNIMRLRSQSSFLTACEQYMKAVLSAAQIDNVETTHRTPVEYFLLLNSLNKKSLVNKS